MKILLIESNQELVETIVSYFEPKGFIFKVLDSYETLLNFKAKGSVYSYDLMLFYIEESNQDGLDVLDYYNTLGVHAPIIFLSHSYSLNLISKIFGRRAEDYLTFPFEMKELELRAMKAVRKKIEVDEIKLTDEYSYIFTQNSVYHGNFHIDLTKTELKILYLLVVNKNTIVSYEKLIDFLWIESSKPSNAIAAHIKNIRKKVNNIPIVPEDGVGYRLVLEKRD